MRLVGATDGFVRRPFLVDGFVKGVVGGLLALALAWIAYRLVDQTLGISSAFFQSSAAALGVVAGGVIGLLGSALSVGRHLRDV